MSSTGPGKLSREDFRKQKDLEAARKAGTAPAAIDSDGKEINPHIPQYISQAPWYLDTGKPSLGHQRLREEDKAVDKIDNWYDRGARAGPAATKYRKGACENCGAITHKKKDCLERPRKKGARYTGKDIQADEVVQNVEVGYAAKRDRWNGYDATEYKTVYDEYTAIEAARQKLREEEIDNQTTTDLSVVRKIAKANKGEEKGDAEFGSSDEDDEDEDKYADAADAVGQKLDTKTRITVRNLRIREDTAKYLINLDPTSAYYDPKTRSMRDAPLGDVLPEDAKFAGDNFLRFSGDAPEVQRLQLFAWQAEQQGNDVHLNANPTQGEVLHEEFKKKKDELRDTSRVSILDKYGGGKYLQSAPAELRQGQTENYVEYSRTGQIIKGKERAKVRSKYPEDVFTNNHTSVWGSWYDPDTSAWGYGCCHSSVPISYCTGRAGIDAAEASAARTLLQSAPHSEPKFIPPPSDDHAERIEQNYSKKRIGEGDVQLDKKRLGEVLEGDSRKKGKFSGSHEVTEEEMEVYKMKRKMFEDPMANYNDDNL